MEHLLDDAARRAARYLAETGERRVGPVDLSILEALESEPLPEETSAPEDVLATLDSAAAPATLANAGGRYFGFVNGGTVPAALAASWLVSTWDQNAALEVMSPAAIRLENQALRWTSELLGLPPEATGAVTTGATMANFAGICAARFELLRRSGWNADEDGLFGAPPIRVVVGDEVHASLLKALGLAGLGRARVERVAVDEQGRMRPDALPALDGRTLLCLQAGNVNTGAFDPARELCARAREAGAWVHVDGAFGLWAAVSPRFTRHTDGFADADSWATDAHKWPNTGYDCGIAIVRDRRALRHAMTVNAAYLPEGERREPSQHGPEMSRRARGVELWAALRSLGRAGMRDLVERTCDHASLFASELTRAGLEVLNDVVINQVLVSAGCAERTQRLIQAVQDDGTCWCGGTVWQGRTAMRISVSSWKTTTGDVRRAAAAIIRLARA